MLSFISFEGAFSDFKNDDFLMGETSFDLNKWSSFSFGIYICFPVNLFLNSVVLAPSEKT